MLSERVDLGINSYLIEFASDPYSAIVAGLKPYQGKKIMLVMDDHVESLYGSMLISTLRSVGHFAHSFVFPSGENHKTFDQVMKLLDVALMAHWNRDDVFLVVGGGVVGDMGAFAASLCLRGIPLIHVPTTLLAQVDSSIGGKTGVDHAKGKNLIGTFYQPKQVIISPLFLKTLSEREIRTGLSEIIKYAIIDSPTLFDQLAEWFLKNPVQRYADYPPSFWESVIGQCVRIKAKVVSADEKESGLRMILNYGHTFGHAIETATQYTKYTHGEAIAIGMNMAALVAHGMGLCDESFVQKQQALIQLIGLPIHYEGLALHELFEVMKIDKKVKNGKLTLVLPEQMGTVRIVSDIDEGEMYKILQEVLP